MPRFFCINIVYNLCLYLQLYNQGLVVKNICIFFYTTKYISCHKYIYLQNIYYCEENELVHSETSSQGII